MSKTLIVVVLLAGGLWYASQQPEFQKYTDKIVGEVWQTAEDSTLKTRKLGPDRLYYHFSAQLDSWSKGAAEALEEISEDKESIEYFRASYCKEAVNYHPVFSEDELKKVCQEAGTTLNLLNR
ncbi:hypothetical protein [Gayadomonas joobiniege]|uniref:hypothetical protein n=1 Tax=Gayadomonas joobiniege TaxID=1234606 RepID=UPI000379D5E8|nr:hypothetical protein [Gayadomonas joobiniege]